jgi:hypothetical protein
MKNLKTFLFLGLITLFSSTAFAQDPHPTKFQVQTEHLQHRSEDNGSDSIKRGAVYNQNSTDTYSDDNDGSRFNLKGGWVDWYREVIFYGLF